LWGFGANDPDPQVFVVNMKKDLKPAPTFDGSEIRRSPVDMVDISLFTGFHASQVVVGDF